MADGNAANYIAKFDGTSWSAVGSGMGGPTQNVFALTEYNFKLYAGGFFTTAGGNLVHYIAKWDGNNWSSLGSGMNGDIHTLITYNNQLYAGGWFNSANGISATFIARWDGTKWAALGSGMDNGVLASTVYNGDLYVGGDFAMAGGVSASHIAKWNYPVLTEVTKNSINNDFKILPNPATDNLFIELNNPGNCIIIRIYTVFGKIVYDENLSNISEKEISIKDLPSGIYFVKITDGVKEEIRKIIIEHN